MFDFWRQIPAPWHYAIAYRTAKSSFPMLQNEPPNRFAMALTCLLSAAKELPQLQMICNCIDNRESPL